MTKNGDDLQERLGEFLDGILERNQQAQREQQRTESEGMGFVEGFRAVRANTIGPILERILTPFEARGLPCEVRKTDDPGGESISLVLEPEPGRQAQLSYEAVVANSRVRVRRSVGPVSNMGGVVIITGVVQPSEFSLEDITPDLVESHVKDLLEDMMGDTKEDTKK